MSWSTPKTWAYKETLSSSDMNVYIKDNLNALRDGTGIADAAIISTKVATGFAVQVVGTSSAADTTTATILPADNTIPQNTEGGEVMTLAITPKSATNILIIEAEVLMSFSAASCVGTAAIFQDTTAPALACAGMFQAQSTGDINVKVGYRMVAGTTSATTFKIRIGGHIAGTMTFGAGRYDTAHHSYLKITEIKG